MTQLPEPPPPSPRWAWFLDVDGTLIDIAPTPSSIHVPDGLPERLARLAERHCGALALVTGRTLDNLEQLMAPRSFPAAGLHGLERRAASGHVHRPPPVPALEPVRGRLKAFAETHAGLVLEDKGATLALHYRQAPALGRDAHAEIEAALKSVRGLKLQPGKMVFEVKPEGVDKGLAVRQFMDEVPFLGRVPVFCGDDFTDEDGFKAANAFGGLSVLVGPARETAASFRLDGPEQLRAWLFS